MMEALRISRPVSKPADLYNYHVAAYLKTSPNDLKVFDRPLETLGFDVFPSPILKENSTLNVEVLLDLVISGPDREYLCECKHKLSPKPLNLNSTEVKDSFLEFVASEKYRIGSLKRDTTSYLLITNCSIIQLKKELTELQVGTDKIVSQYCGKLKARAPKKWKTFDTAIDIKLEWVRNVAIRVRVLEIDDGRLQEAEKSEYFKQEFTRIMEKIYKKNPELIPVESRIKNTIRFETADEKESLICYNRGFFIELSKSIIDQILSQDFPATIKKVDCRDLSFIKNCEIRHHPNVSVEKATELVIEALNDILNHRDPKSKLIMAITPGTYEAYLVNANWFRSILVRNSKGFYEVAKIANSMPLKLSKFLLTTIIEECMRPNSIIRKDLMDFTGFEEGGN